MRLKKIFTAAAAVLLISAVPSFASSTADKGLGLYEYSWFVDGVESYSQENPYYISKYKNRAFAERVGATDGQNMGGIYFSPLSWLTVGLYLGTPVSDTIWNGTDRESLFNIDTYSAKALQTTASGTAAARHSTSNQALFAYQMEMLDESIIYLSDPVDGSALKGTETSSSEYRKSLKQQNANFASAFDFGGWGLGFNFGYATSWNNQRNGDAASSSSEEYDFVNTQYSTALGSYFNIGEKVSLDANVTWIKYGLSNSYKKKTPGVDSHMFYGDDGAMDIGAGVRLNYQMLPNHRMHFNVKYQKLNHSAKGLLAVTDETDATNNVHGTDKFERTGQDIQFGVSDEIRVTQDVRAFAGFSTEMETFKNAYSGKDKIVPGKNLNKYTRDSTIIKVPLIVGLESKLTDNWTGRFSIVQQIYRPMKDSGTNTTNMGATSTPTDISESSTSSSEFNAGLSYKLGNFSFDWLASTDLFVNGPYFVSGKGSTTAEPKTMSLAFAVTYNFDSFLSGASDQGAEQSADKTAGKANGAKTLTPIKR